jgi:putative photosynthetic complex assembly protein
MSHIDKEPFPKLVLIAAATLIGCALAGAGVARYTRTEASSAVGIRQSGAPVTARDLTFFDMADGSVQVRDAGGQNVVFVAAPGTNGFIRGVMRGLARDRHAHGYGRAPAFRLTQWPGGRLSLQDLATGKQIDLSAFGSTNRDAFAQLLAPHTGDAT